ncbi:reverse transcriptase [Tanacetum coccineum]
MRVKAYVGKHTVHSLIDSGSTHTFLDLGVAKKLGCKLRATCPMDVSVANGQIMRSLYECKGFTWTLQGVEFTSDVLILPFGGCEMVLGVQWLSVLGDIKWNFKELVMDFVYNKRRMVLRGTQKATLQWMSGKRQFKDTKSLQAQQGQLLCVYPNTLFSMDHTPTNPHCPQITELLESYKEDFDVPNSLPPKRTQDHRIPLLPNTPPINIRLYKHPPSQKDAMEAMVKELMESGVIRDSQSPYSSPIVMIKKKDGTWRMCVNYRQLNKYTVKDKFPIPVVEELLDELSGAQFFSKLDLRSSYHQIRMHEEDIGKTSLFEHMRGTIIP